MYAADKDLFRTPDIVGVALEKLLGEGCVQDMRKVVKGANKLKKLARKCVKVGVAFVVLTRRISWSMLTQSRDQDVMKAARSSHVFRSARNFQHGPGRR